MFTFNQHGSTNINSMLLKSQASEEKTILRKERQDSNENNNNDDLNTVFCHSLFA